MQIELGGLGSLGASNDANLFDVLNRNVPGASFASGIPDQYRKENLNNEKKDLFTLFYFLNIQ